MSIDKFRAVGTGGKTQQPRESAMKLHEKIGVQIAADAATYDNAYVLKSYACEETPEQVLRKKASKPSTSKPADLDTSHIKSKNESLRLKRPQAPRTKQPNILDQLCKKS